MKKLIPVVMLCMIIGSCSYHMEKRRYLPGYYISISKNKVQHPRTTKPEPHHSINRINISLLEKKTCNGLKVEPLHQHVILPTVDNPLVEADPDKEKESGATLASNKAVKSFNTNSVNEKRTPSEKPGSGSSTDGWFLALSGILMAGFAAAFRPFVAHTRKIGYWALNNRKVTRGLHFTAHCALAGSGLYLGGQLQDAGISSSEITTYSLVGFASLLTILYPHRKVKRGIFKNTYLKQKMYSLFMVLTGLLLFVNTGNRYSSGNLNFPAVASVVTFEKTDHEKTIAAEPYKSPEKPGDRRAVQVLLTVLTAIVSFILCVAIIGGSCALACSGQTSLSIALLVIGLPCIIILSVHFIKSIWQPKKDTINKEGATTN